jgi:hypothetical protein
MGTESARIGSAVGLIDVATLMPPDATTTCTTTNGVCDCATVYAQSPPIGLSGTWSTSGNTLSVLANGMTTPVSVPYCVKGNELHLPTLDTTLGVIDSDLVATK